MNELRNNEKVNTYVYQTTKLCVVLHFVVKLKKWHYATQLGEVLKSLFLWVKSKT